MSPSNYTSILTKAVDELSAPESYQGLFHQHRDNEPMPAATVLREVIELTRATLFPGYYGNSGVNSSTIKYHIGVNIERLFGLLAQQILAGLCIGSSEKEPCTQALRQLALTLSAKFIANLPNLRTLLATDIEATYMGDPAAESLSEVILCYPSIKAISNYRIAHELLQSEIPLIPRMITEMAHSETGIDIHPGAQIGSHFAIDHGTGIVIGSTSIIGNHVKIFQGVTLGAKSFPLDPQGNPVKGIIRHPIIEDEVIIYSNATILGRITIGKGAIVGGNIWVTEDIEPGARIVQGRK